MIYVVWTVEYDERHCPYLARFLAYRDEATAQAMVADMKKRDRPAIVLSEPVVDEERLA